MLIAYMNGKGSAASAERARKNSPHPMSARRAHAEIPVDHGREQDGNSMHPEEDKGTDG